MKKYFILISMFFLFTTLYSQDTTVVNTSTAMQIYQDFKSGIVSIAEPLKEVSKEAFNVLVIQKRIAAIANILILIILLISAIKFLKNQLNDPKRDRYGDRSDLNQGLIFGSSIVLVVVIFIMSINFSDLVSQIIIPEYYVIQDLIKLIK